MSTVPPPSAERSPLRNISGNEQFPRSSALKRLKLDTSAAVAASTTTTPIPSLLNIDYPQHVDIPSKSLVKSLYEQAEMSGNGDQKSLTDAGLLSLEEVLLPAVAYQEEQALRPLQAKAQRDGPPQALECIQSCRKAIFDCIRQARQVCAQSRREHRLPMEQQREAEWAEEKARQIAVRQEQAQRWAEQQQQERMLLRQKRKSELIKNLPRNQEMWREVVYLMTELSKLQKEERLWKEAKNSLAQQQKEIALREQKQREQAESEPCDEDQTTTKDGTSAHEIQKVTQTVQDISLSTARIHQALDIVSNIAAESDRVRKDLYRRYRKDHQFHGYQGIKDPKGLLRALSQSQDME